METDGKKREYIEWFPRAFFGKAAVRFCPNTASLAGWHNSTYDSAWLSHSPVVNDFLRGYLGGQEDRIRLIVKDDGQGEEHPTVACLAEALGKMPVLVETLGLSSEEETEYLVWSFGEL